MKNFLKTSIFILLALVSIQQKEDWEKLKQQQEQEENFILRLLQKYDPENTLYFTRDTYSKLLNEVIQEGILQGDNPPGQEDLNLVEKHMIQYVMTTKKETETPSITYKEILLDLQGDLYDYLKERKPKNEELKKVFNILYEEEAEDEAEEEQNTDEMQENEAEKDDL